MFREDLRDAKLCPQSYAGFLGVCNPAAGSLTQPSTEVEVCVLSVSWSRLWLYVAGTFITR